MESRAIWRVWKGKRLGIPQSFARSSLAELLAYLDLLHGIVATSPLTVVSYKGFATTDTASQVGNGKKKPESNHDLRPSSVALYWANRFPSEPEAVLPLEANLIPTSDGRDLATQTDPLGCVPPESFVARFHGAHRRSPQAIPEEETKNCSATSWRSCTSDELQRTAKVSRDQCAGDLTAKVICAGNFSTVGENFGAEGGTRTRTELSLQRILSPDEPLAPLVRSVRIGII
jgi:hypothetical protein